MAGAERSSGGSAKTAEDELIEKGAKRLLAAEILELKTNKTWILEFGSGRTRPTYFGGDFTVITEKKYGTWGVTDDDKFCVMWTSEGQKVFTCFAVYSLDGVVSKYKLDGSFSVKYLKSEQGKTF